MQRETFACHKFLEELGSNILFELAFPKIKKIFTPEEAEEIYLGSKMQLEI